MTDTLTLDLTRVPFLHERRKIAELWEAYKHVEAERSEAAKPYWSKRRKLAAIIEARAKAIRDEYKAECEALDKEMQAVESPFEEKTAVLRDQIEETGAVLWWDDYSGFETCLLTGLPILSGDEVLETEEGDKILAGLIETDVDDIKALAVEPETAE